MDKSVSGASGKAYAILALSILVLGSSAILVSLAEASAEVIIFYRMLIASTVMAIPFWIKTRSQTVPRPKKGVWLAVLAGIFFSANFFFWANGVKVSGATIPTLLSNTTPIWVGLGSLFIFRRRPSLLYLAGLAIAMVGAAGFVFQGVGVSSVNPQGALNGLLSGVFFAGYFLIMERGRQYLDALSFFWITTFCSGVSVFLIVLLNGQPLSGFSIKTWMLFLMMGLVSQVLGFLATSYVSGHLPATIISSAMLLQLLVTAGLARQFLGEVLTWTELGSGMVLLSGVFLIIFSQRNTETKM